MRGTTLGRVIALAAVLAAGTAASGCGSDDSSGGSTTAASAVTGSGDGGSSSFVDQAKSDLAAEYKGRQTQPPSGSNPAVKGKNVWVVSVGQASPTAASGANGAMKAGKALGWKMHLYDAKLQPAQFSQGVKQAIADNADGVILIAVDCPLAKAALQDAKAKGVQTVGVYTNDCNEIDPSDQAVFGAQVSFGDRYKDLADAYRAWGKDAAAWAIASQDGKADVLEFANNEYYILKFYQQGFEEGMKACSSCKVTKVPWTAAEFGPKLTAKTQAALLKSPGANVIFGGSNPTLGITQGVQQAGKAGQVRVIGGAARRVRFARRPSATRPAPVVAASGIPTPPHRGLRHPRAVVEG